MCCCFFVCFCLRKRNWVIVDSSQLNIITSIHWETNCGFLHLFIQAPKVCPSQTPDWAVDTESPGLASAGSSQVSGVLDTSLDHSSHFEFCQQNTEEGESSSPWGLGEWPLDPKVRRCPLAHDGKSGPGSLLSNGLSAGGIGPYPQKAYILGREERGE